MKIAQGVTLGTRPTANLPPLRGGMKRLHSLPGKFLTHRTNPIFTSPLRGERMPHTPISSPNKPRIILNPMLLQKRHELRLKISPPMMLFLPRDIRNRRLHLIQPH